MTGAFVNKVESLTKLGTRDYIDKLYTEFYPELFELLGDMGNQVRSCEDYTDTGAILTILGNMTNELQEMTNKEKFVLFPYLLKLEEENKKCCNEKPFENLKHHLTNIRGAVNDLTYFNQTLKEENTEVAGTIQSLLNDFEETLTALQDHKERFLYRKYLSLF